MFWHTEMNVAFYIVGIGFTITIRKFACLHVHFVAVVSSKYAAESRLTSSGGRIATGRFRFFSAIPAVSHLIGFRSFADFRTMGCKGQSKVKF